ncbi:unnamed protein product [Schistocephalus solidus]|uniref:Translation initiation factor IF-3, mitochondrial n=1 Tax=Schistocephalus solidus TaxID=70667 RepID=A0A183S9E4_SCHSO|nr:unnamed protein product [Schistocephalus solidus]
MFARVACRSLSNFTTLLWSSPRFLLSTPQNWKSKPRTSTEDDILRESSAVSLLAQHKVVRLLTEDLPKEFSYLISPGSAFEYAEVQSDKLKSLIRKTNFSLLLVEDAPTPVFKIGTPVNGSVSGSAAPGVKSKYLRLRAQIDDHMLEIKIKQAKELLQRGYPLSVVVRPSYRDLNRSSGPGKLDEAEKARLKKLIYEKSKQRFIEAFKGCSTRPPKIVNTADYKEFTILFSSES